MTDEQSGEPSTQSTASTSLNVRDAINGLSERMGIEFLEVTPQGGIARMPVAGNTQPYGILHGGASVVLAEGLGSYAAQLHAGSGRIAVGIEVNASHHRSVSGGFVTATATAVSLGRTLAAYDIVLTDDEGRRTCSVRLTCMLRDAPAT